MLTTTEIKALFWNKLIPFFSEGECKNIFSYYRDYVRMKGGVSDYECASDIQRILEGYPIQYLTNIASFYNHDWYVDDSVLIPRPETEELVAFILEHQPIPTSIIDIGVGSGCILLSVQEAWACPLAHGIDLSSNALKVASKNATNFGIDATFELLDFIDESKWSQLKVYDCIISNPPYISILEKEVMTKGTLAFEPHMALFSEEDPDLFYKKIAKFGQSHLSTNGSIFLELNEFRAQEIMNVFTALHYKVDIRLDMQGKQRMLKAYF